MACAPSKAAARGGLAAYLKTPAWATGAGPDGDVVLAARVRLARRLTWAWDDRWGYLTASLSNMGTGLRLSLLVHLPALALLGRLSETLQAAQHLGISIRGAHGEGSQAAGDL